MEGTIFVSVAEVTDLQYIRLKMTKWVRKYLKPQVTAQIVLKLTVCYSFLQTLQINSAKANDSRLFVLCRFISCH